ncbi:MAG: LemA family protein [Firmicutes bacterium]|nr:LemA family protein [Bacillota bacterium]
MGIWIVLAIVVLIVLWIIGVYNGLIRKRTYVNETESRIDVNLKQKVNVLNNLVDTVKMQTSYEGDTLVRIIDARNQMKSADISSALKANDNITNNLMPGIFALSESYPQLKANDGFIKIMAEVKDVEQKIAFSRTAYNTAVFNLNTAIKVFPANIVANMFGFKEKEMYELEETKRKEADDYRISEHK